MTAMTMRTIVLHGALGERFGREFKLNAASAAQAVRALMLQLKGFREHLRQGHYRVTRVRRGRPMDLDEVMIRFPLGGAQELHIVPEIFGAGGAEGRGVGKIIAGVALVTLAVAASFAAPGSEAGLAGFFSATLFGTPITTGMIAAAGVAVALSGIALLLTKNPMQNESFVFGGQDNVAAQGGPVPLVYGGPILAGSVAISAGLFTEALSPGTLPFDPSSSPRVVYFSSEG